MFEDLLASAHLIEREEAGYFWLMNTAWESGIITLSLDILTVLYPDIHPHWQVTCSGVRDHSLSFGLAEGLQCSDDHVLLWAYNKRKLSLYFSGKCENSDAVIGALYSRHAELTKGWIPFQRFLNPNMDLVKLINGNSGCWQRDHSH